MSAAVSARPDPVVAGQAPIGALSLDVAGVLVLPEPTAVLPDAAAHESWDAVHYLVRTRQDGAVPLVAWSEVAAAVGVDLDRLHAYVQRLREVHTRPDVWRRVVPGAAELLTAAATADVPVAVVSNTARPMTADVLVAAGLAGRGTAACIPAERTFDSSVIGLVKPDPRFFAVACRALGRAPEDVVHVGDTLADDVHGARAAGLGAVHLTPFGWCDDTTHRHVRSLVELVADLDAGAAPPRRPSPGGPS